MSSRQSATAEAPENLTYQPPLFRDGSHSSNIIPIPTLISNPAAPGDDPRALRGQRSSRRISTQRAPIQQQSLEFYDAFEDSQTSASPVVIYCDAPVAPPVHRLIAAAFDASMVLIAAGLFLGIFFFAGGNLALSKQNAPFLICVAMTLVLFYRTLWCLADGDTPGMRFAGLKLVDFDGRPPDRERRGLRLAASLLSLLSVCVGLLWAIVDEEKLTWHDHISQTFPTYS